jgi:hypothetical protein
MSKTKRIIKTIKFIFFMILIFSIIQIPIFSKETDTKKSSSDVVITSQDEKILSTQNGLSLRLLQLKIDLETKIETGKQIAKKVLEKTGKSNLVLSGIVLEFEELYKKTENLKEEKDKNKLIGFFYNAKGSIILSTQNFRENGEVYFSQEEIGELKEQYEENKKKKLEKHETKLSELKDDVKKEVWAKKLELIGIKDEELILKIQSDEITIEELKEEIISFMSKKSEKEIEKILKKIEEETIKENENLQSQISKRKKNFEDENKDKKQDYWEKLEEAKEEIEETKKKKKKKSKEEDKDKNKDLKNKNMIHFVSNDGSFMNLQVPSKKELKEKSLIDKIIAVIFGGE